jgi:hypothetical protein
MVFVNGTEMVRQAAGRPFDTHMYRLVKGRPMIFGMLAYAREYGYEWRLEIKWISAGGRPHVTSVTDAGGRPFVTVPQPASRPFTSEPGTRSVLAPPVWTRLPRPAGP